ncbi:FdhF/YdeP family oxidoreductase [Thalassospira marina]|uniref:Formate dehydrogenase n=1 Tax=Thalassospira marina TaxID=2048283 RepID=A0A2N3KCU2_9PROT|nr:FdhF/YdeP family oxidoreductase [Thalassospira marina]PKR48397.1 formate dehydrogenase [Thalassospira marina]
MKRSELDPDDIHIKHYDSPTGGWGSLKSLIKKAEENGLLASDIWAMLGEQNKPDGFMCVSCSWAKPKDSGTFEFCENGAKATIWEHDPKKCDPEFFANHTISELLEWNDHDLEKTGRLTAPMKYNPASDKYEPIEWDVAFREIAAELKSLNPDDVVFYASGRASLEASHMYQLFARIYGSNNLPDSSNMCHESTSVGLPKSIGSPVGTVQLEDFAKCDMIFFIGHNVGTNAPRMLHPLQEARKRGVPLVTFNPLPERGLVRFKNPQSPAEMLSPGPGTEMSSDFVQLKAGGDLSVLTGICKHLLVLEDEAQRQGKPAILDHAFIREHTSGFEEFCAFLRAANWDEIVTRSGIEQAEIERIAALYASKDRVIANYGMGLTQHREGVENVQMLCNMLLMRGNIGKEGAGISPVRGHSNVQGQRTVGISEKPELVPLDKLAAFYRFEPPRHKGLDTVETCQGILDGRVKGFIGLGGNFSRAVPETALVEKAWRHMELQVQIATKLNRNHLLTTRATYLLPCLGRSERDTQVTGDQWVSMEDSTANIHGSFGKRAPASDKLMSEPAIIARLALATCPEKADVPWQAWIDDYALVRDAIERAYPDDFKDFNQRFTHPGGFHRNIVACKREWKTDNGKANFITPRNLNADPDIQVNGKDILTLLTIRSNDQFNTTIYGYDDRLRGIHGTRMVLLLNANDIARLGLKEGEMVNLRTAVEDGVERRVEGLRVVSYEIPAGNCAGYYPELNPLMPLFHHSRTAHVPAAKSIPVHIEKAGRQEYSAARH